MSHPNWSLAIRLLARVLPGSKGYDPDEIAGLGPTSWEPFDLDDREPSAVEAELQRYCLGLLSGVLVVVTAASYSKPAGPFFLAATDLSDFIADHVALFDDVFVSNDVVIVAPAGGTVVVVHHSGYIASLRGRVVRSLDDI